MKRSEIVEKEAVETDGRADRSRGEQPRKPDQSDGQNEVERVKKGVSRLGRVRLEGLL